jgi:DNA repair protein RecN (Recombination protein N)
VRVLAAELAGDLASYAAGVDDDPLRLAAAQERHADLTRLCRPHGTGVDAVLRWASDAERRLAFLDAGKERGAELAAAEQSAAEQMLALAGQLSTARQAAARSLQRKVTAELSALSMTSAQLVVRVESGQLPASPGADDVTETGDSPQPSAAAALLGVDGADEVELLFASGDGLPLRPLARTASGGELSRVVLALEVVLASGAGPASMIFDEVDAGIGGEAALEVGRRLALLARSRQVICVTHLPQVAAYADRHLLVDKNGRGSAVHTGVQSLDLPGRVRELSRMLAGVADSELARGHASELLAAAAASVADRPLPHSTDPPATKRRRPPPAPKVSGEGRGDRSRPQPRHPVPAGAP